MKKKLLNLLLSITIVLTLIPTMAVSVSAGETAETTGTVGSYTVLLPKGVTLPEGVGSGTTVTTVTSTDTEWGEVGKTTWYVATGTVTIDHRVTVKGDVHLILMNGCNLTITGSSNSNDNASVILTEGNRLSIYSQSSGDIEGKLTVGNNNKVAIGNYYKNDNGLGDVIINGGQILTIGNDQYSGTICAKNITINGGIISTDNKGDYNVGLDANGGTFLINDGEIDLSDSQDNIYGTNITITGGKAKALIFGADNCFNITGGEINAYSLCKGKFPKVNISGGTVNIDSKSEEMICGIGGNTITISEADPKNPTVVNINVNVAYGAITAYSEDDDATVSITGGKVNVSAIGDSGLGIYCTSDNGNSLLNVAGGDLTVIGNACAIIASSVTANNNMIVVAGEDSDSAVMLAKADDYISVFDSTKKYARISPAVCYIDANINGKLDGDETEYPSVQSAIDTSDNIKTIVLVDDDIENVIIPSKKNITLDLNGHYLLGKDTISPSVIKVCDESSLGANDAAKLTIVDSNADGLSHNFEVSASGLWVLTDKANTKTYEDLVNNPAVTGDVIKVTGGVITSNNSSDDIEDYCRGILVDDDAYLTLKSGNIIGNANYGIRNMGYFVMDGGLIAGNIEIDGGAGVDSDKSFVMNGGKITDNTSSTAGGGVSVKKYFKMTDGLIFANKALGGGGVLSTGTAIIGGSSKIYGNSASMFGDNLLISDMNPLTIGNSTNGTDGNGVMKPADGMNIGITLLNDVYQPTAGAFTTNGSITDKQYFFSDINDYYVKYVTDHLEMAIATVKIDKNIANGKIEVDNQEAIESETVTITITPNKGYELDEITVTDKDGNSIVVTDNKFEMPNDSTKFKVTVSATFKQKTKVVGTDVDNHSFKFIELVSLLAVATVIARKKKKDN